MLKSHEKFHSANGKRQVLIAEADKASREMLRSVLQDDYELLYAKTGLEVIDKVKENSETLSLVMLVRDMPGMSGRDALKEIKKDPEIWDIPVIAISSDRSDEVDSLSLGAIDFLAKPYPQAEVIKARVIRTIELSEDRQIINSTERDPLTGLYNREYFYRYAEQFDHHHKDMKMDAIVLDINHFNMINERFGTDYGNEVLRSVGERVREVVRDTGGIVCRREADTFLVYCPHGHDYKEIIDKASIRLAGEGYASNRVRLRMGVYANVDKTYDIERRFDRAKMAADNVKGNYSRNIGIYDRELHKKEIYAELLIEDFHKALNEKQFKVYYQPKFYVKSEIPVLSSAEALVRWNHPELGLISPGVFIPLFEDNGLIEDLDHYVWREAAAQVRKWKDKFGITVPVSVNVSRVDMFDPGMIGTLQSILEENGLTTRDFFLEITESAYTRESEQILSVVEELRKLGFRIEMDDFGTGYSSLNMISTLPIDALKLDMEFIRTAFADQTDTRILEVIIDIADHLGVPVIAEGVETEEQLHTLKYVGCDIVQGFYFSEPVPPEDYEHFVIERKELGDIEFSEIESGKDSKARRKKEEQVGFGKIANALSSGYESIYYVDTESNHYLEFNSLGKYEDLQIDRSGTDFFVDAKNRIPEVVYSDDIDKVTESLQKENLISAVDGRGAFYMIYRLMKDGNPAYYRLKCVRVDGMDDRHLIIGVSNLEEKLSDEDRSQVHSNGIVTFYRIAKALSQDYFGIYYMDAHMDHFMEYSSSDEYRKLGIEKEGNDFFEMIRENSEKLIHPDDRERVLSVFTRENVMKEIEENNIFTLEYRMMLGGKDRYVHMKVMKMDEENAPHIVLGISDIDKQVRREQSAAS